MRESRSDLCGEPPDGTISGSVRGAAPLRIRDLTERSSRPPQRRSRRISSNLLAMLVVWSVGYPQLLDSPNTGPALRRALI